MRKREKGRERERGKKNESERLTCSCNGERVVLTSLQTHVSHHHCSSLPLSYIHSVEISARLFFSYQGNLLYISTISLLLVGCRNDGAERDVRERPQKRGRSCRYGLLRQGNEHLWVVSGWEEGVSEL